MDPASAKPPLAEALNQLWARFLPEIEDKVAILASAASALAANELSIEQQEAARDVAHKLAGVLGVFGLAEGTHLAREAEVAYGGGAHSEPAKAARLVQISALLRALVSNRKP